MPENWNDDDEQDTPLVKQLRQQVEKQGKALKEAEARAAAAEGKVTERNLSEILTAKGVNPKAAKFLVKDGVDASDENAVTSWLEENSDLFPAAAPAAEAQPSEGDEPDEQVVAGYQQLSGMSAMQRPADINKFDEINRTLPDNATKEQVYAAFVKGGL